MNNKVILISIDGMRPDGLLNCGNAYVEELKKIASYTFDAKTVFPSVTLPCHMSLFHSVPPERHGTTTNTYMPQVRPINGLFEQIKNAGKVSAMYYGWEPIRDVSRPASLKASEYINAYAFDHTDAMLTESALKYIKKVKPDFVFLYMVETDEKGGHDNGWMSEGYLKVIYDAINNVKKVIEDTKSEYTVIITADHGGHDRSHGTDMKEDMTIPMVFYGPMFTPGKELSGVSILDLAPTIADIIGAQKSPEWEGKSLICEK
ncbi:MAG: alkaline phosphatase family protein [Clostridia bacterium]|nr:alkaline phosphatase family protein [Clostridia bacterium]